MLLFGPRFQRAIQRTRWMLLLCVAWSGASGQTAEIAGTLPEDYLPGLKPLLAAAVRQSPKVLLQQIEIARREAYLYQANSERWPSIGGNIRYDANQTGVSGNSNSQSRDSGLFYNASADQAVFHWGAIRRTGDVARVEVAIAKMDYQEGYRLLAVELRQGYLGLVWRKARLGQARYALGLKEADLATSRDERTRGVIAPGDLAGRELDFNEAQLAVERLQADFDAERRRLGRLVGWSDIPEDQIPLEIPEPRYDPKLAAQLLAGLLRDGARNTFRAQVAELHIKEADLNYRIARVRLLPKFNASLSHSRESSTTANPNEVTQTAITRDTVELRGSWTIFDGFATKGAKLLAKTEKRQWERQLQIETESVMDQAQQLEREVALDARAMDFAAQRRVGAETLVRQREEEAKSGRASQSNVNEALSTLRFMQANEAEKRAAFLSTWGEFISRVSDDPALKNLPFSYVRPPR